MNVLNTAHQRENRPAFTKPLNSLRSFKSQFEIISNKVKAYAHREIIILDTVYESNAR